ncbi:MAG: peptidyl-prolyl cis-trans isomerase [Elusimicrobia bacterium]|nr:peptidyl-prolyl cis-trans isomerase [Elusimicrobiota bacterium]
MTALKKLAREPLLHFLLLGAAMFAVYSLVSTGAGGAPGKIVITQGQLASLWENFTRTRQRPPTAEEWEGLVRQRVREEVFYREALALGLDKDDSIIRRRLQQKMEFLSDDVAIRAQPTEDELKAYLEAHPDFYRRDPQVTFQQVFLNPEKHAQRLAPDAARLLAQLNKMRTKTDVSKLGDPIMLDNVYKALPSREIARLFGDKFAKSLEGIPVGQWQGPVESAFGAHLVFVRERAGGGVSSLAEVQDAVRRDWDNDHRLQANEKFYQNLLTRYTVTIETPGPADAIKIASNK